METNLARKVWEVSRLLNRLPWEDAMTSAPEAWLDWVLKMHAKYPPGSQKFVDRKAQEDNLAFSNAAVGWSDVLTGSALDRFMSRFVPAKLRERLRASV